MLYPIASVGQAIAYATMTLSPVTLCIDYGMGDGAGRFRFSDISAAQAAVDNLDLPGMRRLFPRLIWWTERATNGEG
jgi:hypothetical protein